MVRTTDRRRIAGPEKSIVPLLVVAAAESRPTPAAAASIPSQKSRTTTRRDNRLANDLRPIFARTGMIPRANGSAYFEAARLKVVCAVYGPRQVAFKSKSSDSMGNLVCEFKFAPFSGRKRRGFVRDAQEKEFSIILHQSLAPSLLLHLYPKSQIDVFVQVLEADGVRACLAAAITCASMALADAGIEMRDVVIGSSVAFFPDPTMMMMTTVTPSVVLVDCTDVEDDGEDGSPASLGGCVAAYMPSINEVTHLIHSGEVSSEVLMKAMDMTIDACARLHQAVRQVLVNSFQHEQQQQQKQ